MTNEEKPKPPGYSLLTLLLLVTIAAIGISHVSTANQLQRSQQEIERLKLLSRKVADEDISDRLKACLEKGNIVRFSDLVERSEDDLFEIEIFGVTSHVEVVELLRKFGLSLAED